MNPPDHTANPLAASLIAKFENRSACIAVVGLGYAGLPMALRFADAGFRVIGFDADATKVGKVNRREDYIPYIRLSALSPTAERNFSATTDPADTAGVDAVIICVPTPLTRHREPDLTYVMAATEATAAHARPGQLFVLESTTYPGTTDEEIRRVLEARGLSTGEDVFIAFSPEREDPGNQQFTTRVIPKIVGGVTPACLSVAAAMYGAAFDKVVMVSSARTAEMTKLLENIHRAVNIGLVNEMKIVADRMGIDIHEVIRAAATKPFGFTAYYPGPGLGGHCIPVDPFYLTWKAREYGINTRFIELAGEVNRSMPEWVIGKVAAALNDRAKPLHGSRILVLGVTYKKNVDDTRESASIRLVELLLQNNADVRFSDPHVARLGPFSWQPAVMENQVLSPETLAACDCVLLATNHDAFDYEMIRRHAPLIVDTRGVYLDAAPHIVKA